MSTQGLKSINSKKGYCDGWNACIDAIGSGVNGN